MAVANNNPEANVQVSFADGLRNLADLLDSKPDTINTHYLSYCFNVFVDSREELARKVRAIGGHWDKTDDGSHFIMRRDLGGGVTVDVFTHRANVCERVQVGTRIELVPDPELIDELPKVRVEEPVYEWVCPESLLAIRSEDFSVDVDPERPF